MQERKPSKLALPVLGALGVVLFCAFTSQLDDGIDADERLQGEHNLPQTYEPGLPNFQDQGDEPPTIAAPSSLGSSWDCRKINSAGDFPNAFRAILDANDPKVIEESPYLYKPGPHAPNSIREHGEVLVDDMCKLRLVYNGDQVCVKP